MSGQIALVKPEILRWARVSAGLELSVAAHKAGVGADKLSRWEGGDEAPTISQVRKLGGVYKRPLAVFFLSAPPKDWDAMHDTRRTQNASAGQSAALRFAIRETWERRAIAVDLASELDVEASFDVKAKLSDDPESVAKKIRKSLPAASEQGAWRNPSLAFSHWRMAIEGSGVLVFSFPKVEVEEVRGFSISLPPIPAIAVNSSDMPASKTFTMMHELAHIALRSGVVMCEPTAPDGAEVEAFCNHVAGATLVPRDLLLSDAEVSRSSASTAWSDDSLRRIALDYSVSREVVARRLLVLGKASRALYVAKRAQYAMERAVWLKKRKDSENGPGLVTTKVSQLGRMYTGLVLDAYAHRAITASDVSTYLGVKTKHFSDMQVESIMRSA